jgi:two-component system OmpR family response regulator
MRRYPGDPTAPGTYLAGDVAPEVAAQGQSDPSSPFGADSTAPVLVVDDDPHLRQLMQWALEDEGLPVETASDGREAVALAARREPALVVLDMGLPRLNGEGVVAELRAAYGERVPVVVVTADGHAAEKARRVGARAYLHKPFELDDFVRAVQQTLRR